MTISSSIPRLVASSNRAVSTAAPGRWTYLTTLPLIKTFLTELCHHPNTLASVFPQPKPCTSRLYITPPPQLQHTAPSQAPHPRIVPPPSPTPFPHALMPPSPSTVRLPQVTYQMWIPYLLHDADIVELDVEVLVHALEGAADRDVVLELDGYFVVDEGFEEAVEV